MGILNQVVGIEEKEGQCSMIGGTRLPKRISRVNKTSWEELSQRCGIQIAGDSDELFYQVQLPDGWQIVGGDHPMWTTLKDDKGRGRALVFYKAAWYDERAELHLCYRYQFVNDHDSDKPNIIVNVIDYGQGPEAEVIHEVGRVSRKHEQDMDMENISLENALHVAAKQWLEVNYPDYRNCYAYW